MGLIGVSVVICCHNSAERLPPTLEHLKKQILPGNIKWEVIVVDNASTDSTAQTAKELWNSQADIAFKVVSQPKLGLSNARIKGFESAQYDFVCFIDDDNWVAENWVQTVYDKMLQYPQAGAIGGKSTAVFECPPPVWFNKYQFLCAVGEQAEIERELPHNQLLWGSGLTVRKEAWNNLLSRGFSPLLQGRRGKTLTSGEDSEICYALLLTGWKLYYTPLLQLHHFMPCSRLTWKNIKLTMRGIGRSKAWLSFYKQLVERKVSLRNISDRYWLGKLLDNLLSLIKAIPILLKSTLFGQEGDEKILENNRVLGNFLEQIRLIRMEKAIKAKLSGIFWES